MIKNYKIDWIFSFCKICWDYKKIMFDNLVDFKINQILKGICTNCNNFIFLNSKDILNYYENWYQNNRGLNE